VVYHYFGPMHPYNGSDHFITCYYKSLKIQIMNEIDPYEALENSGMELMDCLDSMVPACCEHGCKSVLLSLGMI